jgi:drug/metabolite transporter (DMT)-like permease
MSAQGTQRRRVALALLCLALGAAAMGASPVFVRLAEVGPYASAFWRTALALPFLWIWAALEANAARQRGRAAAGRAAAWRSGMSAPIVLAGLFFTGDLFFWHLAILGTTVANATFLATTAPIWVALGAWLSRSEAIGVRTLAGLALCILGGAALVRQSYGYAPERLAGDLCGVATALFFGLYVLAVRAARADHGPGRVLFLSTCITAVCLLAIALALEPTLVPGSVQGLAALLALALVSQVAGQGLAAVALGTLPATFSSLVIFLEAIAAALFGWVFFGEALGALQAVGGVLILAGIWAARPRAEAPGA